MVCGFRIPMRAHARIKIAHHFKLIWLVPYDPPLHRLLADPVPGGYPGRRGSTRGSVRYTGRTSLTVAMSCRRVERHTGFYWSPSIRLMGTDPHGRGYIRTLGSTAGDRNSYTGQPSSPKGMLRIFKIFFVFNGNFVLYPFGRICNLGLHPFTV